MAEIFVRKKKNKRQKKKETLIILYLQASEIFPENVEIKVKNYNLL